MSQSDMAELNRQLAIRAALPSSLPSDLQMEIFMLGYCQELFVVRRLQYLYERDCRVYWNKVLSPEDLSETIYYYDTDYVIREEMERHLESGDLELAYIRASGPNVRYDDNRMIQFAVCIQFTVCPEFNSQYALP